MWQYQYDVMCITSANNCIVITTVEALVVLYSWLPASPNESNLKNTYRNKLSSLFIGWAKNLTNQVTAWTSCILHMIVISVKWNMVRLKATGWPIFTASVATAILEQPKFWTDSSGIWSSSINRTTRFGRRVWMSLHRPPRWFRRPPTHTSYWLLAMRS